MVPKDKPFELDAFNTAIKKKKKRKETGSSLQILFHFSLHLAKSGTRFLITDTFKVWPNVLERLIQRKR